MSSIPSPPSAVIFDWDDTLIDNWESIHSALNATLTAMGHEPWPIEKTRKQVRQSMRNSFPPLFGDQWEKAAEIFYEHITAHHLKTLKVLPYAQEILQNIKNLGLHLGIVSNKTGHLLREEVSHLGWESYFSHIIGAGDADKDKPQPDPIYLCMEGSGIATNHKEWANIWFVGDAPSDVECAQNAGVTSVLLSEKPISEKEFKNLQPNIHVESLETLDTLLSNPKQTL